MDQKILSLAAEKTADGLQEFLQTLKDDDVSIGKQVLPKADARHDDRCKGDMLELILPLHLLPTLLRRQGFIW